MEDEWLDRAIHDSADRPLGTTTRLSSGELHKRLVELKKLRAQFEFIQRAKEQMRDKERHVEGRAM